MTGEQATVNEFVDRAGDREESVSDEADDVRSDGVVLFRLSDDPFVNEAAAEIGRQLADEGLVEITPTTIRANPDAGIEIVVDWVKGSFERALSNTHRRTTVAHQVNAVLEEMGQGQDDGRWIPSPDTHYPERDDETQTIYPDDRVDVESLESNGIPSDEVEYVGDDASRLYQRSPTFVGNPSGDNFERYQVARCERYLETYLSTIRGEFSFDDHACMLCGSEEMPTNKGVDDKDLEFNQSFDIRSTTSAVSKPLGMGGLATAHSGRCVACLVAGFYYTLMPKVVRFKDRETCGGNFPIPVYRVFTPRGDFTELVGIRDDFDADLLVSIDEPTGDGRARRGTLPATATQSRGLQTLQFYESVLRYANRTRSHDYYEFTVEHRPTALISYTSATKKGGNTIRDIREVESIDPDEWAYRAVERRTQMRGDGTDDAYWPFDDLLNWYARLERWYWQRNQDGPVDALDDIGYGILERNLKRLARGHFEVAKTLEQEQGENAPYVLPINRAANYFTNIMQQTVTEETQRIDDEAIESIKRVASNVGETFHKRDDISVLIALQNASTSDEFLQAFEKASMQAQKKASADDGGTYTWTGKNDVATVLKLINDSETFEPAKRMFVIHASLSAQYINAQRGSDGGDSDE